MIGHFEFKCRRCHKIYDGGGTGGSKMRLSLILLSVGLKDYGLLDGDLKRVAEQVGSVTVHECDDGGMGLADIIGCQMEEL